MVAKEEEELRRWPGKGQTCWCLAEEVWPWDSCSSCCLSALFRGPVVSLFRMSTAGRLILPDRTTLSSIF